MATEKTSVQHWKHEFSEKDVRFIKALNEKLRNEEKRFIALYDKLKLHLNTLCLQRDIDDFNYDTCLSLFSNDRECNARYGVECGDPIWEYNAWSLFTDEDDRGLLEDNWNEYNWYAPNSADPLVKLHFCHTMHCIVFHGHIPWQDILCIDDVWLEMKIDYQFLSNDKMKKRFYKINKDRIKQNRLL